jgi:hypothetical protein
MFLGKKKTEKVELIDVRDYARFVLTEGTLLEQRSVLECVSTELVLKNGKALLHRTSLTLYFS